MLVVIFLVIMGGVGMGMANLCNALSYSNFDIFSRNGVIRERSFGFSFIA
jgi:hypothetical protein